MTMDVTPTPSRATPGGAKSKPATEAAGDGAFGGLVAGGVPADPEAKADGARPAAGGEGRVPASPATGEPAGKAGPERSGAGTADPRGSQGGGAAVSGGGQRAAGETRLAAAKAAGRLSALVQQMAASDSASAKAVGASAAEPGGASGVPTEVRTAASRLAVDGAPAKTVPLHGQSLTDAKAGTADVKVAQAGKPEGAARPGAPEALSAEMARQRAAKESSSATAAPGGEQARAAGRGESSAVRGEPAGAGAPGRPAGDLLAGLRANLLSGTADGATDRRGRLAPDGRAVRAQGDGEMPVRDRPEIRLPERRGALAEIRPTELRSGGQAGGEAEAPRAVRLAAEVAQGASGMREPGALGSQSAASGTLTGGVGGAAASGSGAQPASGGAAPSPALAQQAAQQMAGGIQRAVAQGQGRVQLQLNPAELGRVDVRMEFAEDGLRVRILVERADTFDMMTRDARALERALQEAGVRTQDGGLSFDLKGDRRHGGRSEARAEAGEPGVDAGPEETVELGAVRQLSGVDPVTGRVDLKI